MIVVGLPILSAGTSSDGLKNYGSFLIDSVNSFDVYIYILCVFHTGMLNYFALISNSIPCMAGNLYLRQSFGHCVSWSIKMNNLNIVGWLPKEMETCNNLFMSPQQR